MLAKSRYVPQSRVVSVINGPPRNYMLRNRAVNFMQVKSVALFLKASMPMRAHNIDLPEIYWYFCIVATKWFFFTHHMVSFLGNVWSHVLFFDQLKQANTGQILFFFALQTIDWKLEKEQKMKEKHFFESLFADEEIRLPAFASLRYWSKLSFWML